MKNTYFKIFLLLFSAVSASAQVPVLNSYPASGNVIYLDFDGHNVEGTSWNYGGPIVCDAATLNTAQITAIFNRVAEDYRPFTINVTTDSAKYEAAPATRRMRIVLTPSSSWYGSAGGVAFVNSFSWGDNTPCFVFTALLNNNIKYIAEAASHEAGHTLGLRHQSSYDAVCNKTSEYNSGRGSGEIGWAPIMGVGYYQNMTLWNYGANPFGCTNYQDDLSIITGAVNGIGFRSDDYTDVLAISREQLFVNNAFVAPGILEQPNDADAMKFTLTQEGRFQLEATPYSSGINNTGSNADLEIQLLNSVQAIIGTYNDANTLNAMIDTTLNAGIYYLVVKGKGNVYAPNYAVLGSYSLFAAFTPGNTLPLHKLQLNATTENKLHKLQWEIIADERIVTQTIEASTNGIEFKTLTNVNDVERSFSHLPSAGNLHYYRLKVGFNNGRYHFSNIVALRNNGSNGKPSLIGNTANSPLMITSPSAYTYSIYDHSGRTITHGNLQPGTHSIQHHFTSKGIYIIRFQNGQQVYSEKFIR